MSKKIDFREFAASLAGDGELGGMLPVVEKELIHYEVLNILDKLGYLSMITFQGGTCLRLCYGSPRYSEDLDFSSGEHFGDDAFHDMASDLEQHLYKQYDVRVRVKQPNRTAGCGKGVEVMRWKLTIDTAPSRPDLPSQKMSLEVASVPARTRELQQLRVNYRELPLSYGATIVACQSIEEIFADKIISLPDSKRERYRDLWDLNWIDHQPEFSRQEAFEFLIDKHSDYSCKTVILDLLHAGEARVTEFVAGVEFKKQMERFIPRELYDMTIGRNVYLQALGQNVSSVYRAAATFVSG